MSDQGPAAPSSTDIGTDLTRPADHGGLRLAGRLSSTVVHTLERRLALLDEIDTLAEQRAELLRSAQLLGGHDSGERPAGPASGDARHRLATTRSVIDELERTFDELKRAANETRR